MGKRLYRFPTRNGTLTSGKWWASKKTLAHPTITRKTECQNLTRYNIKTYTATVERCLDTGLYVGFIPGFPGAHTQAETLDELNKNLREVVEMLLEDGEPILQTEFIDTQNAVIAK